MGRAPTQLHRALALLALVIVSMAAVASPIGGQRSRTTGAVTAQGPRAPTLRRRPATTPLRRPLARPVNTSKRSPTSSRLATHTARSSWHRSSRGKGATQPRLQAGARRAGAAPAPHGPSVRAPLPKDQYIKAPTPRSQYVPAPQPKDQYVRGQYGSAPRSMHASDGYLRRPSADVELRRNPTNQYGVLPLSPAYSTLRLAPRTAGSAEPTHYTGLRQVQSPYQELKLAPSSSYGTLPLAPPPYQTLKLAPPSFTGYVSLPIGAGRAGASLTGYVSLPIAPGRTYSTIPLHEVSRTLQAQLAGAPVPPSGYQNLPIYPSRTYTAIPLHQVTPTMRERLERQPTSVTGYQAIPLHSGGAYVTIPLSQVSATLRGGLQQPSEYDRVVFKGPPPAPAYGRVGLKAGNAYESANASLSSRGSSAGKVSGPVSQYEHLSARLASGAALRTHSARQVGESRSSGARD